MTPIPLLLIGHTVPFAVVVCLGLGGSSAYAQEVEGTKQSLEISQTLPVAEHNPLLDSEPVPSLPIRDWAASHASSVGVPSLQIGPRPSPRLPRPPYQPERSRAYRGAQKVLAGAAMGVLGYFGGILATVAISGEHGHTRTGAHLGAAAGATLGVLMVR